MLIWEIYPKIIKGGGAYALINRGNSVAISRGKRSRIRKMQILRQFAFLRSEAGNPPSDIRPHEKDNNRR